MPKPCIPQKACGDPSHIGRRPLPTTRTCMLGVPVTNLRKVFRCCIIFFNNKYPYKSIQKYHICVYNSLAVRLTQKFEISIFGEKDTGYIKHSMALNAYAYKNKLYDLNSTKISCAFQNCTGTLHVFLMRTESKFQNLSIFSMYRHLLTY